ncbi:restriction endonuclease subunit S [Sporolactobacillus sp. CQH2019]|uniref:restriction endonuclease subunit S n=1 Tax=Sporolactobacillus sp. CQH2019 TaxID=3023512 RepID=UPI00236773FF|nr:restriction endonuclease subunit S [Sporolactobacillus sp. CQH2019]MDD9149975.1 restriction endonuclease subunit S [Sporolactobacillus sp. CQH2019]
MPKKNYPKLRFKGFTNAWEQRELGELMEVSSAKRVHRSEWTESGVPFLRSSDVVAAFNHKENEKVFISQEHYDVLVAQSGKLRIGDLLVTGGGSIGVPMLVKTDKPLYFKDADLIWFKNKGALNGNFLFYSFISDLVQDYIKKTAHIGTISHYTIERGKKTPINITPLKDEQAKIGAFFEKLDSLIATNQRRLDKLKLLKKGYLQQIFEQKLRFKGYSAPWERRKLGEVVREVSGNNGKTNLPILTISAENGWMNQKDRFSQVIAGLELKNYTLLSKGQLSYNHGNSKLAKFGAVFELKEYAKALVPRIYHSFETTDQSDATFIDYLFSSKLPDRQLGRLVTSGARMDGLLNINKSAFFGISINIPSISEQHKIGQLFQKFDNLIIANQHKLDHLKKLKKAYLQQMFI